MKGGLEKSLPMAQGCGKSLRPLPGAPEEAVSPLRNEGPNTRVKSECKFPMCQSPSYGILGKTVTSGKADVLSIYSHTFIPFLIIVLNKLICILVFLSFNF